MRILVAPLAVSYLSGLKFQVGEGRWTNLHRISDL